MGQGTMAGHEPQQKPSLTSQKGVRSDCKLFTKETDVRYLRIKYKHLHLGFFIVYSHLKGRNF